MATLFLMCGLPGAGKTTPAKRIERGRDAPRLTPDEWVVRLFGMKLTPPDTCRVTEAQLDAWWKVFGPPTADELRPRSGQP